MISFVRQLGHNTQNALNQKAVQGVSFVNVDDEVWRFELIDELLKEGCHVVVQLLVIDRAFLFFSKSANPAVEICTIVALLQVCTPFGRRYKIWSFRTTKSVRRVVRRTRSNGCSLVR